MSEICVRPTCHEFDANILFNKHGLKPFFAADRRTKDGDGKQEANFETDGEGWKATLYFQRSGIENPGDQTPAGTRFAMETMREFRIRVEKIDDDAGQKSFNAHIAPRWPKMKSVNGRDISPPSGFGEGVNVRVQGSNIHFSRYQSLFKEAAEAVGINSWYFENRYDSTILDAERYVRIHCDESGPIHSRDGAIARLALLLQSDREGYRKLVQNDSDDYGTKLPGYYHTVTLGPERISEAFPNHVLPKEIKHYYAREAMSFSKKQPLRHPKLGASYQKSRWDGKIGLEQIDELIKELDETVHSVLADSGVESRQRDGKPFEKDAYFSAENVAYPDGHITSLDLTEIRQTQESIVIKHLADGGFSPVEWESLQTLVTDGGTISPKDIAEAHGRHVDSVRRALNRIPEIVETEYAKVSLKSPLIADMVHEAVTQAKNTVRKAVELGAKAVEAGKRGMDENTSALLAWASKYEIDINDRRAGQMKLRAGDYPGMKATGFRLRQLFEIWIQAGRNPDHFRNAEIVFKDRGTYQVGHFVRRR